jgi:hypothetical protein
MASKFDDVNKIGNLFNSWGKILFMLGGGLISCAIAYYRIFDNEKDIAQERKDRLDATVVMETRSDSRFNRAMEIAKDLREQGDKKEQELKQTIKEESERTRELEIQVAFMKGQHSAEHKQ